VIDVPVAQCVTLSHASAPCKNYRTDRGPVCSGGSWGPRNNVLDWGHHPTARVVKIFAQRAEGGGILCSHRQITLTLVNVLMMVYSQIVPYQLVPKANLTLALTLTLTLAIILTLNPNEF